MLLGGKNRMRVCVVGRPHVIANIISVFSVLQICRLEFKTVSYGGRMIGLGN